MENIDKVLKTALSPTDKLSDEMIKNILSQTSREKEQDMNKIKIFGRPIRKATVAAAATALVLVSSVPTFAAIRYFSASEVSSQIEDEKLAEKFRMNNLMDGTQSQTYGDYTVTLLGVVSGEELSDLSDDELVDLGKTYIAVAIKNADGTPLTNEFDQGDILVSPYIRGLDPARYNSFTLNGGFTGFVSNGIAYRVISTDTVEPFADRGVYVGVSDGSMYNDEAFIFDKITGEIKRNESYDGVNALFTLPLDASKADAKKAEEIINHINNHKSDDRDADITDADVEAFVNKLTPENIDSYADPIEETRQTVSVDENGKCSYSITTPDGTTCEATEPIDSIFPDGEIGMSPNFTYSVGDDGIKSLLIVTHTLNPDGTVTVVVYSPKGNY